ncbi:competence protein CoiA family protein [Legionella sp. W05-934-2]|uniref:competence protein CoiA family protein n=1 Tax=Legionella sp. W05-934-2 TaxID=1198649 RepID=UPI003461FA95
MKFLKIKLPFGLNENNTIAHISSVDSGKNCNCVCPSCGSSLIAAKGTKNQHHFKHASTNECVGGLESAIHLAAKQIIMERRQIKLPEFTIIESALDSKSIMHTESKTIVKNGRVISFDSVQEEQAFNGMKADIQGIKKNEKLIIEIFYRHKVDDQKIDKIKEANISAIEIDLSDLTPEDVKDWETFWSCINEPKRIQWLNNAKAPAQVLELSKKLKEKIQKVEKKYEQQEIIKQRREREEKNQLKVALSEFDKVCSEDIIAQLKEEANQHPILIAHSQDLKLSLNELPDFLDLDVPNGDWIYSCDRRVWQTAVYSYFICRRSTSYFSIKQVDDWLQNYCNCKVPPCAKIVGKFGRRHNDLVPEHISENMPSSWATLRAYLNHLSKLGILIYSGNDRKHNGSCWFEIFSRDFHLNNSNYYSLV